MFEYPLLQGNAALALKDPYSIVLTASTAKALFGDEDPMNKMVRIDNEYSLKVTAILKDIPSNSSLQFHFLVPFEFFAQTTTWVKEARNKWNNQSNQMFVELQPGVSREQAEATIKNILCVKDPECCPYHTELLLHPLEDWNLRSQFKDGESAGGYISSVLATPLVFYFLKNRLKNYEYHVEITADVFILSSAVAMVITFITISFQTLKAAVANPVESLKTE